MPSLSLSFDVLDVWDVGCFVYECFWMLHLNLPRSHWEDLYRPFVTCHLSPVTCYLSQCRTQCRGYRSHSWRCGRVHWWAVMRWTSGFLPSNLRMCSWRRAWVEIKFKLCRCLSLSSNKNLMHFESCFRITPLSSDAASRNGCDRHWAQGFSKTRLREGWRSSPRCSQMSSSSEWSRGTTRQWSCR